MSDASRTNTVGLSRSILTWMLLVAITPLILMACQGYHCAREAVIELRTSHLLSILDAERSSVAELVRKRGDGFSAPGVDDWPASLGSLINDRPGREKTLKLYLVTRRGRFVGVPPGLDPTAATTTAVSGSILSGEPKTAATYVDYRGVKVLGASTSIPGTGWILVAEIDSAEAFAWLASLRRRAVVTGVITLVLVFLLAYRCARQLSEPLRQLSATARRIAEGHREERLGPLKGREAREVASAFNAMLDELAAAHRQLVLSTSLSAIGELSSSIVHEMRNPLSSVKMNLKALREKVADDKTYSELAEIASGQVERLERMLNDLLQYGKPIELKRDAIVFGEFAADLTGVLTPAAGEQGARLTVLDDTGAKKFSADREQLRRAVTNLVENAIRAASKDGHVILKGEIAGTGVAERIVMSVTDSGPGIPDDTMDKIFEPFFTTRSGGAGLGLANVRKIVELHGGVVTAENRPEGGAKFVLELPMGGAM